MFTVICFPIVIVWRVNINPKKKIVLFCIFSLVSFTIAATIVRGSIFAGVYKTLHQNRRVQLSVSWIWFWFFIEFSVCMLHDSPRTITRDLIFAALIIASLVSFRALFTHKEKKLRGNKIRLPERADQRTGPLPKGVGFRRRAKWLHDSLLRSFKASETIDDMGLPIPATGTFSPTFIMDIEGEYSSTTELSGQTKGPEHESNVKGSPPSPSPIWIHQLVFQYNVIIVSLWFLRNSSFGDIGN